MKAITMRMQKFSRPGVILLATAVAIITSMVVANAAQTFATPNAVKITFNLASGANSTAITPATNTSVQVMGCCTTLGYQAVGQASLLHIPTSGIQWVGLESYNGSPAAITQGNSSTAGTHIVAISLTRTIDIQVASASTILVHNGAINTVAGNVTLIW
jgi:hypothetical protein